MSEQDTLISVENLGKKFSRNLRQSLWYGLKDLSSDVAGFKGDRELRDGEFWANRHISFDVKRGECLGLIGHNGAGKTTLLKMLNGLIKPDEGQAKLKGSVAALIALGAGFSQVLTCRENIIINGSILGLSKQHIMQRLDEIIEFAELEDFVDSPVRNLSSGMQVRLGFAVAAILIQPDILFLDEILAVGDSAFRAKCLSKIDQLLQQSAVILVSHNIETITRVCSSGLCLDHGQVIEQGDLEKTVTTYREQIKSTPDMHLRADIDSLTLKVLEKEIEFGEDLTIEIKMESKEAIPQCQLKLIVAHQVGEIVAEFSSKNSQPSSFDLHSGENVLQVKLSRLRLLPGHYTVCLSIFENDLQQVANGNHLDHFDIIGRQSGLQAYQLDASLRFETLM